MLQHATFYCAELQRGLRHRRQRSRPHANRAHRTTWGNRVCGRLRNLLRGTWLSGARVQSRERKFQKFPDLRTQMDGSRGLRRLSWAGVVGARNGFGTFQRSGASRCGRTSFRSCRAGGRCLQQPPCMGIRPARDTGVPRLFSGRSRRSTDARSVTGNSAARNSTLRTSLRTGTGLRMCWLIQTPDLPQAVLIAGRHSSDRLMISAALGALELVYARHSAPRE